LENVVIAFSSAVLRTSETHALTFKAYCKM